MESRAALLKKQEKKTEEEMFMDAMKVGVAQMKLKESQKKYSEMFHY